MKTKSRYSNIAVIQKTIGLVLIFLGLRVPRLGAAGGWLPVSSKPPHWVQQLRLLSDGTAMAQSYGDTNWYGLIPSAQGGYTNGTWNTNVSAMIYTHGFYGSQILKDGRFFVVGGEDGTGGSKVEVYDPLANTWTEIIVPNGLINTNQPDTRNGGFRDPQTTMLPNGDVMISPILPIINNGTVIYSPINNLFSSGPACHASQNEVSWVKLPDDSILTVDKSTNTSERYIPSLNQWIPDANVPVQLYSATGAETGPGLLLPDGRAFFLGGSGNTAYYTPSGNTNQGGWTPGPIIPNGLVSRDAPAAMMVNGKILCALSSATNAIGGELPVFFYEFDPVTNAFTQVNAPGGGISDNYITTDNMQMLDLPDGTVLFSQSWDQLYVYVPGGAPVASGKPTINSVTWNGNGSLHLAGTLFNGISQGASFGDDAQMDSNYPLARFTDGSGNVIYGRTLYWSSTGVQTGNTPVTTEVIVPGAVFYNGGNYSLQVVANGIASDPVSVAGAVWVDFNYGGPTQNGTYSFPYKTLAQGTNAVPTYGAIFLKPGSSLETMTISKPMTILAIGGPATIGH